MAKDYMGGVEKSILIVIGALIIINILFQSAGSFFPNWTSIGYTTNSTGDIVPNSAVSFSSVIPVVMPFIVLLLFIFLVLGLVNRSRSK